MGEHPRHLAPEADHHVRGSTGVSARRVGAVPSGLIDELRRDQRAEVLPFSFCSRTQINHSGSSERSCQGPGLGVHIGGYRGPRPPSCHYL
jgi:hypothetical protein